MNDVVAAVAEVLLAHEQVGQRDQVDQPRAADGRRQRLRELAVQPDAVADDRRQLPPLGQPLADDHVIQADDRPLEVGDVAAEQVGRFDDAAEALGQHRVERDLAQVVQQAADERFGRLDARCPCPTSPAICSASSSAQHATATQCFQNSSRLKCPCLAASSACANVWKTVTASTALRTASKPSSDDGAVDVVDLAAHADVGAVNELEDARGERPGRWR